MFTLIGASMDNAAFLAYGWRIAFLVSVVLVAVGLVVRLTVVETPVFRSLQSEVSRVPVVEVFQDTPSRRNLVLGLLARWAEGAAFDTWGVFVLTYAVSTIEMPRTEVLVAVTLGGLVSAAVVPAAGRLADRFGRRAVFAASLLAVAGGSPWLACGFLVLTAVISTIGALLLRPVTEL